MEESILTSIKKLLNVSNDDESFDMDIIILINGVLDVLKQIGVESTFEDFRVTSKDDKWEDYLIDINELEIIKTYIYLKVKIVFDPPANSTLMESYKEMIKEYEWRLNTKMDYE